MGKVIPASELMARRIKKRLNATVTKLNVTSSKSLEAINKAKNRLIELDEILHTSPYVDVRENAVLESLKIRNEILHLLS